MPCYRNLKHFGNVTSTSNYHEKQLLHRGVRGNKYKANESKKYLFCQNFFDYKHYENWFEAT